MSESETGAPSASGPRWGRRILIAIGLSVLLAGGYVAVRVGWNLSPFSERGRHTRVLDRLMAQLSPPLGEALDKERKRDHSVPSGSITGDSTEPRTAVLSAMQKAIYNVFYYPKDCSYEKLVAIADRLEASHGAELQTITGCLEIFALFEEVSPKFRTYQPVEVVYIRQEEGSIPRLPKK